MVISTPQHTVWSCRDLRVLILQKSFQEINKYYINICKCYEKFFFKK